MTNKEIEEEISKQPIPTKEECLAFYEELTKIADVRFVPYYKMAIKALEQEPTTGHWVLANEQNKEDVENDNYRFICSECHCSDIHAKNTIVPYCWNCGAKMESEG